MGSVSPFFGGKAAHSIIVLLFLSYHLPTGELPNYLLIYTLRIMNVLLFRRYIRISEVKLVSSNAFQIRSTYN
jgi:hypothetical protein